MLATDRAYYCVECNADHDGENGLEVCPASGIGQTHLWAQVGHVLPWFPHKRPHHGPGEDA